MRPTFEISAVTGRFAVALLSVVSSVESFCARTCALSGVTSPGVTIIVGGASLFAIGLADAIGSAGALGCGWPFWVVGGSLASGASGPTADIEIEATQIIQMRERLNRIFAKATGQEYERIVKDTDRNFWMTAGQAKEYGLVHRIVEKLSDV